MLYNFSLLQQWFRELLVSQVEVRESGIYANGNYFAGMDEIPVGTKDQVQQWILETLNRLREERDQQRPHSTAFYHHLNLDTYYPCTICQRSTRDACPECDRPHCFQCRHNLNVLYLRPEAEEQYISLCVEDYHELTGQLPNTWGWPNRLFAWIDLAIDPINKGMSIPASEIDSWVSDPKAADAITFFPTEHASPLDTFSLLSFSSWIAAHTERISTLAEQTGQTLMAYDRRMQAAAQRADAGVIDYSQYE